MPGEKPLNACPNCGQRTIKAFDKLFKPRSLVCQNCGEKLEIPNSVNTIIIVAVAVLSFVIWSTSLDTAIRVLLLLALVVVAGIVTYVAPLQRSSQTS